MVSGIYRIVNKVNNKVYIGSSHNLLRRKIVHFYSLKANSHNNQYLQRAFNKYGTQNFIFEILFTCPLPDLSRIEQIFIDNFKPEYNILLTAYSSMGYKHTENSINIMRIQRKGIKPTAAIKSSIATREKIVYQYNIHQELIDTFTSVKDAETKTGILRTNIAECCRKLTGKRGKPLQRGGFIWRYDSIS